MPSGSIEPFTQLAMVVGLAAALELHANLTVLRTLREHGFTGRIAATAHGPMHLDRLRRSGADLVLQPFADAAEKAAELLSS